MSYSVVTTVTFDRSLKRLSKKYPSLKNDFFGLYQSLQENPRQGKQIRLDCYKIRLAILSKGKGKSSGARVVTYIQVDRERVVLLAIYDKSEKESITDAELNLYLDGIEEVD